MSILWEEMNGGKGSHFVNWWVNGKNISIAFIALNGCLVGLNDMYHNLWKNIFLELSSFSHFVCCVVGEGKETYDWEDRWVRDRPPLLYVSLFIQFPLLKNPLISSFFVWTRIFVLFSFGFHCSLFNSEMAEVVSCLYLIEE